MKLFRFTGRPVELADLEAYDKEFKENFDLIMAKNVLPGNEDKPVDARPVNMLQVQADLTELDKQLEPKYKLIVEVDMPKNRKQWAALVAKYECPILVAREKGGKNDLVLVLDDRPFS
jgi:hypothetical protein